MTRFLTAVLLLTWLALPVLAEELPSAVFTPETSEGNQGTEEMAITPIVDDGELALDFSTLMVDNAAATPIPIDPIDKPTPTPAPTPNYIYETYENANLGVSFKIPYTWLENPSTNKDTTVQFVEPKSEMMDVDGYQTRITVERVNMRVNQTQADARASLESTLNELAATFTRFTPGNIASTTMGDGKGAYCYFKAEYDDGNKTYLMNGRIAVVAYGTSIYQVRLTAPRAWYAYYEHVFRQVKRTFKYL